MTDNVFVFYVSSIIVLLLLNAVDMFLVGDVSFAMGAWNILAAMLFGFWSVLYTNLRKRGDDGDQ